MARSVAVAGLRRSVGLRLSLRLDPDVPWVLDPAELKSKCKNTPFDEAKLEGRVLRTIVAGRTVYEYV